MEFISTLIAGDAWTSHFWATPCGLFILISILVCSGVILLLHWQGDNFIDKLYYTACAVASFATLLHVIGHSLPFNIVKTLMLLMTFRFIQVMVTRLLIRFHEYKGRTALKIEWHHEG
jgi:uncharacterized protein involved in cysteine biosynthesis